MRASPSISVQILLAVLLTVISVLAVSSIIELNLAQRRATQTLQAKGTLTADRIANSLSYPLWNLNREQTERVVLDEIGSPEVFRIRVFDENGELYVGKLREADGAVRNLDSVNGGSIGTSPNVSLYSYSRAISFKDSNIGNVTLDVSDALFQAELRKLRRAIAIKLLVLVVLLSVVMFVAFRVLVIRPLSTLKAWVETIPTANVRQPPRSKHSREISSLAEAFGNMSLNLHKKNEELEAERAHLEKLNRQMQAEIGERQRTEQSLRTSEERFSRIFNLSPYRMGILRISDGVVLAVNDCWVRETGFAREEVVKHSILELDQWLGDEARQRVAIMLEEGKSFQSFEGVLKTRSGEERVTLSSAVVVDFDGEPCYLWASNDITERKHAETALKTSEERLRALSARIQSAREEEGTRIAREIHDELGSALTGLKWDLEAMDKTLSRSENGRDTGAMRTSIGSMTNLIESTIDTVRRISSDLRPGVLDDLGLVAAIEWQVHQFRSRAGINCHWKTKLDDVQLNRESATAVFRIFQEILTNVLRHSQAANVYVELQSRDNYLDLEVRDDGRGITESERANAQSLGLLGMRERALLVGGEVHINGESGKGTTVLVSVPIGA